MDQEEMLKATAENELLQFLGVKVVKANGEHVVLTMPVTPKVHQYLGIMNGGVSLFLAETAASIGVVAGQDLTQVSPVGVEINANHLRTMREGEVRGVTRPLHIGGGTQVWEIRISDAAERLVCVSRITLAVLHRSSMK